MTAAAKPAERKKRTITEIRDSKHTGEKMVYTSVLDYTSAKWAEAAGVDVCVVGDSLAMTCHGHPSTVPATMDMMVLHSQAVRRGAPGTFVLGCMPYQSYNTIDRALANATRFMQEALVDAVKPQGGKSQRPRRRTPAISAASVTKLWPRSCGRRSDEQDAHGAAGRRLRPRPSAREG